VVPLTSRRSLLRGFAMGSAMSALAANAAGCGRGAQ